VTGSTPSTLWIRDLARALVVGAAIASGAWGQAESQPSKVSAMPRDRYTAARPVTLERFRSCFASYDLDGDSKITRREARGAAMSDARFREMDVNGDGFVTADEFDLVYAIELRGRGQKLDAAVTARVAELEAAARARGWKPPETPPPVAITRLREALKQPPATPPEEPAPATRGRYRGPESVVPPRANPAPVPTPAPASRPAESRPSPNLERRPR